jgi:hypothetical protein
MPCVKTVRSASVIAASVAAARASDDCSVAAKAAELDAAMLSAMNDVSWLLVILLSLSILYRLAGRSRKKEKGPHPERHDPDPPPYSMRPDIKV